MLNIEESIDEYVDLDTEWINEYEKIDKDYEKYYAEDLQFIRIQYIYINKTNDIEKIRQEKVILKMKNCLSKEEVLQILKQNSIHETIRYRLLSVLKCNITIAPQNLVPFLKNKIEFSTFVTSIKNIDSITFEKSIVMFHDLNELIILFHETVTPTHISKTKRILLRPYSSHKRTNRKQLKDVSL